MSPIRLHTRSEIRTARLLNYCCRNIRGAVQLAREKNDIFSKQTNRNTLELKMGTESSQQFTQLESNRHFQGTR